MCNVRYRRSRSEDLPAIIKLHMAITESLAGHVPAGWGEGLKAPGDSEQVHREFEEALHDEDTLLAIAECGDVITGYALAVIEQHSDDLVSSPYCTLQYLATDSRFRGRGIAEGLIQYVAAQMVESGISVIDLLVWEHNSAARSLYEKLGFCTLERRMVKRI